MIRSMRAKLGDYIVFDPATEETIQEISKAIVAELQARVEVEICGIACEDNLGASIASAMKRMHEDYMASRMLRDAETAIRRRLLECCMYPYSAKVIE